MKKHFNPFNYKTQCLEFALDLKTKTEAREPSVPKNHKIEVSG